MSYKAQWKNKNVRKCSSEKASCGCQLGGNDIPIGMVKYRTSMRIRNPDGRKNEYGGYSDYYLLRTPEYNKVMTQEEADQLDMETGRSVPHGRNSCGFVMSRAARKRGIKSNSYSYNHGIERNKQEGLERYKQKGMERICNPYSDLPLYLDTWVVIANKTWEKRYIPAQLAWSLNMEEKPPF